MPYFKSLRDQSNYSLKSNPAKRRLQTFYQNSIEAGITILIEYAQDLLEEKQKQMAKGKD